jgi:hypothetical protein
MIHKMSVPEKSSFHQSGRFLSGRVDEAGALGMGVGGKGNRVGENRVVSGYELGWCCM